MGENGSVLVVHGLWMNGFETGLLRHRLGDRGYSASTFSYASMHSDLDQVLERLEQAVRELSPPVHLVGHSLGGLMALRLLESRGDLPPGRAVLLGAPVAGSVAARSVSRWPIGPTVLGSLALAEIVGSAPRPWRGAREIGVIAGSLSAGLGRIVAQLPVPNDGTVTVEETRLEGATDHLVLHVSHTSMLLSSAVADAVARFLATGRFAAGAADVTRPAASP